MSHQQQYPFHHSQQDQRPVLPPPPPSPRPGGVSPGDGAFPSNAARNLSDGTSHGQRSRPVSSLLPSITTAFLGAQHSQASATPTSGHRISPGPQLPYTPATPSALNPRALGGLPPPPPGASPGTPIMEPYNPRQWSSRGQVSGSQMVFQQRQNNAPPNTAHVTGMEATMPSPPPPYSPRTPDDLPRAAVPSPVLNNIGFTSSPLAERAPTSSPQVSNVSPAFPPPPGQSSRHRERSASGIGGSRSFFNLPGVRGKQPAIVEPQRPHPTTNSNVLSYVDARPPAARRAASTGHMHSDAPVASSSAAASVGRDSPESSWQPGMPLPGPPPGPPPPGARSQSLNRPKAVSGSGRTTPDRGLEAPRPRRTAAAPSLGPVPPTPANWNEGDQEPEGSIVGGAAAEQESFQSDVEYMPLRIDTGANRDSSLTRRPAKRDTSAQGIRERRSQSRANRGNNDDDSKPTNLVFSPVEGSISRRREHMRSLSGTANPSAASSPPANQSKNALQRLSGSVLTPPYTPAVGKQAMKAPGSASSDRPISHLLHTPIDNSGNMPAPLSPARPASAGHAPKPSPRLDSFALQAIERHRKFIEKEAAAGSDEQRLELFASFMVHESRLRRDRYTAAYNTMASDILDLTRDMWRSYSSRTSRRAGTPSSAMSSHDPTVPSWASDGQPNSAHGNVPSSASSMGEMTPATDAGSIGDLGEGVERHDARQWADTFKPSLSPIPSMAVSTVHDEDSSRGRTASRWWESNSGGSVGHPDRMKKSKRETKYMGVNPAEFQDLAEQAPTPGASDLPRYGYGPNEYPPEKVGWHDGNDFETPMATPHQPHERSANTPGVAPLDVSRLVTLPPPYPRHHPAVNNSHPQLTELRAEHRTLADHTEIQRIKEAYVVDDASGLHELQDSINQRRAKLRTDIQSQIADGSMSFASAAQAEADFEAEQAEKGKAFARAKFDAYEASISHPLNTLLTERLDRANLCIRRLREELENNQHSSNPNQAQEEGDEHPERLEKLTLLKWLFEARELLHKEMFDLHSMRSEKYSEVVLTPFRISKAQAKIDDATAFFKKDASDRQTSYAKDSLKRLEELQSVIDRNVTQGVEDQLSAFWDIAPGLLEVIQHIPPNPSTFSVAIPLSEYEENPSYHAHPLQYLHSLLTHAEKSAYQFIESQINLLCLLHEVRTATTNSRLRLLEIERHVASPDDEDAANVFAEMQQARREAEDHLTLDLKEKVGEVERQWQQALGDGISECKERVGMWLEESGGLPEEED